MPEGAPLEFQLRVALDEERALRMNPARPGVEGALLLELFPVRIGLEDEDVALALPLGGVLLEVRGDDPVVKLRLHRDRRSDEAAEVVVDEIGRLGVFPVRRAN